LTEKGKAVAGRLGLIGLSVAARVATVPPLRDPAHKNRAQEKGPATVGGRYVSQIQNEFDGRSILRHYREDSGPGLKPKIAARFCRAASEAALPLFATLTPG